MLTGIFVWKDDDISGLPTPIMSCFQRPYRTDIKRMQMLYICVI